MNFNQKLQTLRKQKGITQQELADALFVSRTAISKWESGKGYPSIDSLKLLAEFFSVTVDELLSCDQLLIIAEADKKKVKNHFLDIVFGLLDISVVLFLFLPLFAQKTEDMIQSVSLLFLTEILLYLRVAFLLLLTLTAALGILTLALQNSSNTFWVKNKHTLSLILSAVYTLLFIISLQPYAAVFVFVFFVIKLFLLAKAK